MTLNTWKGDGAYKARLRLMAEEYIKFLATATGLTSVLPEREPTLVHPSHAG